MISSEKLTALPSKKDNFYSSLDNTSFSEKPKKEEGSLAEQHTGYDEKYEESK